MSIFNLTLRIRLILSFILIAVIIAICSAFPGAVFFKSPLLFSWCSFWRPLCPIYCWIPF